MRFQLNGRICLLGAVVFGLFAMVLVLWIHPAVYRMTLLIPDLWIYLSSGFLAAAVITDTAVTTVRTLEMNHKLQEIQNALNGFLEESREKVKELKGAASLERIRAFRANLLESFESSRFCSDRIRTLLQKRSSQESRFLRTFPRMHSIRYAEAFQKLREAAAKKLPSRKD